MKSFPKTEIKIGDLVIFGADPRILSNVAVVLYVSDGLISGDYICGDNENSAFGDGQPISSGWFPAANITSLRDCGLSVSPDFKSTTQYPLGYVRLLPRQIAPGMTARSWEGDINEEVEFVTEKHVERMKLCMNEQSKRVRAEVDRAISEQDL